MIESLCFRFMLGNSESGERCQFGFAQFRQEAFGFQPFQLIRTAGELRIASPWEANPFAAPFVFDHKALLAVGTAVSSSLRLDARARFHVPRDSASRIANATVDRL